MTREQQIHYLKSFGYGSFEKATIEVMRRQGVERFLTDDQLAEVFQHQVEQERIAEQIKFQNQANERSAA